MKTHVKLAKISKKTVAFIAAATTLFAGLSISSAAPQQASAATRDSYADTVGNPTFEAARQKYGLPKDMKDGATLHAFEWSFKTIMENIPDIAKAGYTSIQTEPIVKIKDNRKLGTGNWYLNWYYVYQPTDMAIGNYVVGSEDEFKEMCALAHQYGLRIIVDSVSNHFTSDFDVIADQWKDKSYFHADKQISDYNNREDCTQNKLSGLWDLNTQDSTVAQGMLDLLKQTVADGADGFRFDAAKHIELSDEVFGGKTSNYWDTILQNGAQYQYGEVLEDANVREADYANLFNNSSVAGGGITDSSYGHEVRNAVQFKNLGASHFTSHSKVSEDKTVNWVESHDNFANGEANIPQELSDEWIKYGWAGVTAQKNGMSLFFDRPYHDGGTYGTGGTGTYGNGSGPFTENSKLGDAGSDLWKDPEVVAVNHFRNAMVGEASNVSNCGDDNCLMVERYAGSAAQDGMVVANANGADKNLAGTGTKLANGTYTDEVTGTTITVSNGTVTSGTVKAKSIAAFSNKTRSGKVSTAEAYPNKGTIPGTSKKITLRSYQSTNTTYSTSDGQSGSYQDGDVIKIGADAKSGEEVTVTVKGTGADGEAIEHTYTYTKHGDPTYDPNDGTQSPCDKYCMEYMTKNGYDPDHYVDAEETYYEGDTNTEVTSVKVSGDNAMDLAATQSVQLKATVTTNPEGGRATVKWNSSDESIATVDSKGKVSGLKAGTVKITATAGGKSGSITITITGEKPEVANVIYATKPSGWSKMYAYVYTGDGATAKNNAAWPGVEMTAMTAADPCAKAGTYKYEVPDLGEGTYRVIFSNGSGSQMPGASQPGLEFSGKVSWDGSSASLTAITCTVTPPDIKTADITFSATADLKTGETLYAVGDWGQGKGKTWNRAGGVKLAKNGNAYTGTTTMTKGQAITARLIKVDANGKTTWDEIGDVKATADKTKTVDLKWTNAVENTVDITINAAADLKTGETLYAVGDWGQGKGKTWNRAGGVKLARYGNAYTGTTKVGKGNAIAFRLIKVDANGKTTWDSAKDRKSKADKTKALGVSWTSDKVNEDGTIPDDSAISISGKGVADGKLSIQKGNLAELYVIGTQDATPSDAVWWSDGAAVAVSGTGTVYGVQTGTAKVNVKVGNQTATITITVK